MQPNRIANSLTSIFILISSLMSSELNDLMQALLNIPLSLTVEDQSKRKRTWSLVAAISKHTRDFATLPVELDIVEATEYDGFSDNEANFLASSDTFMFWVWI